MPIVKVTNYIVPTGNAPAPTNKPCLAFQTTWDVDDEEAWEELGEGALEEYGYLYGYASILDSDQDELNVGGLMRSPNDEDVISEVTAAFNEYYNYQEEYNAQLDDGEEEPDIFDYMEDYDSYIAIGACQPLYDADPQEMEMDDLLALADAANWKSYQPRKVEVVD